jgi:hypothetical protein
VPILLNANAEGVRGRNGKGNFMLPTRTNCTSLKRAAAPGLFESSLNSLERSKPMTYLETKTGAAANRRGSTRDPMELLTRLRSMHPSLSKEAIFAKWQKAIHADDDYEEAVDLYCFSNLWAEQERRTTRRPPSFHNPREAAEKIKNAILWNAILPNGKRLPECTFGYVKKLGGVYSRIGRMGKANELIGSKLKPEQVAKLDALVGSEEK